MSLRVRAISIFLFLFFSLSLLYGRAVIQNDGITYYALTSSLIHDHNFDLSNEAKRLRDLRVFPSLQTGKIASIYSCGFAFLYAPILLLTEAFPVLNQIRPYAQNAIIPFADALGVFIGSVLFSLTSLLLSYKLLKHFELDTHLALFFSFAVFCGTPLIFYTFTTPSFSHAADAFLFSAIFYLAIRKVRMRNVFLGFFLGLSVLLRNVNAFVILPIVVWVLYFEHKEGKHLLRSLAEIAAGGLPIVTIQLSYNFAQYGSFFATGYPVPIAERPQHVLDMIVSLKRMLVDPSLGLFVWSPVALLSLCGLIIGCIKRNKESVLAIMCFVSVVGALCFFRVMTPGATFGNRFLSHIFILWVVGLYELFKLMPRHILIVTAVPVLWSFLLFNAYYINFANPESRKFLSAFKEPNPIQVFQASVEGFRKTKSANNPLSFWYRSLGSGQYPSLHFLIWHPESRHEIRLQKKRSTE
ncbi:MAG TPA: hypothetical protein VLH08_08005 [Acidobacteriota bacterium]|nr:hypothetical protein [Acidobacteriota bacterium]